MNENKDDNFYNEDYENADLDSVLNETTQEEIETLPLDSENTALSKEEEEQFKKLQEKVRRNDLIMKTYLALEKKPTEEEVEKFKNIHGEIYFISLTEKENFIFRPLKRHEWRSLMTRVAKIDDFKKAEAVVIAGVVWPKLNEIAVSALSAGSIDALRDMILEASNFMTPDRAVQLVRKL